MTKVHRTEIHRQQRPWNRLPSPVNLPRHIAFSHSEIQRCRTATATPASQIKALLQAAPVKHLTQNYDIAEPLDCQVSYKVWRQCPRRHQPNSWRWSKLENHVGESRKNIPYSDVTLMKLEHASSVRRIKCKKKKQLVRSLLEPQGPLKRQSGIRCALRQ